MLIHIIKKLLKPIILKYLTLFLLLLWMLIYCIINVLQVEQEKQLNSRSTSIVYQIQKQKCFNSSLDYYNNNTGNSSICFLDDILQSKECQPKPGNSIFFHETTCGSDYIVKLSAR